LASLHFTKLWASSRLNKLVLQRTQQQSLQLLPPRIIAFSRHVPNQSNSTKNEITVFSCQAFIHHLQGPGAVERNCDASAAR
jgi:hypothetical protein